MMQTDAALAILALVIFAVLFLYPWQELCTAYARQVAFEQRDAIFDMAASGKLDFASPEYKTIRSSLEVLIRFAHEATILYILVHLLTLSRLPERQSRSALSKAIMSIGNQESRREAHEHVWRAQRAFMIMLLAKSPLSGVFALAYVVARGQTRRLTTAGFSDRARPYAEAVQIEAEQIIPRLDQAMKFAA